MCLLHLCYLHSQASYPQCSFKQRHNDRFHDNMKSELGVVFAKRMVLSVVETYMGGVSLRIFDRRNNCKQCTS